MRVWSGSSLLLSWKECTVIQSLLEQWHHSGLKLETTHINIRRSKCGVIISWTVYYTTLKVNILYTKQHEWMVRIQCWMKRARHKIIILIWFYLHKLQKASKTILFRAICLSIKKNKEMLTKVRIMVIWERSMIEKGTRVGGFWGPGYVSFLLWGCMSVCWNH